MEFLYYDIYVDITVLHGVSAFVVNLLMCFQIHQLLFVVRFLDGPTQNLQGNGCLFPALASRPTPYSVMLFGLKPVIYRGLTLRKGHGSVGRIITGLVSIARKLDSLCQLVVKL